jgi:hypothetical protein
MNNFLVSSSYKTMKFARHAAKNERADHVGGAFSALGPRGVGFLAGRNEEF